MKKITIDPDRFDELQLRLLEEIIASVRDGLRQAGVSDSQALYEATEKISFSVAAVIDGSRIMDLDGARVIPVLSFAKKRNDAEELVGAEGGSWMHEYVSGAVDEVFESESEDEDED